MPTTTPQVILPNEYQQDVNAGLRRQQMIQALAGQLMQQPKQQAVNGLLLGGSNAGTALSQVLGVLAMQRGADKQDELERSALTKYKTGEQEAIKNYLSSSNAGPSRESAIAAMTSQYPTLQKVGETDLGQYNKENTPLTRLLANVVGSGGQGQGTSPQGLRSLFPNLTDQEIAVALASDPTGKSLIEANFARNKPMVVPDNGTLVTPAGGGNFMAAPGAGAAQAANVATLSDIKNQSKARYDLAPPVETPQGTSYPTTLQMVQSAAGGTPAGGAPGPVNLGPAKSPMSQGSWKVPPQVQAERDQTRLQILQQELSQTTNPQDRAALEREIGRMGGGLSGNRPPQPAGVPGVQVPYNNASKAADKTLREADAKTVDDQRTKADSARSALNQIAQMRQSIRSGTFQGGYANLAERVAAFAGPLGIPIDQNKLSDTQYVKSTLQNLIVPQVKKLGVNPTDADARRIEAMVGSITTDPGAFDKIMSLLEQSAQNDIKKFDRMDSHFRQRNSLEGFDYQGANQQPAAGASPAAPMSLDEYLKSRSK